MLRRAVLLLLLYSPAHADPAQVLGQFDDWTAALHQEEGQVVCYAFTRAAPRATDDALQNANTVLSVAERPTERDDVAIAADFNFRHGTSLTLSIAGRDYAFYTAEQNAFANDGAAVVSGLGAADVALDHGIGPRETPLSDQFSLRGFTDAYAAITRACPES